MRGSEGGGESEGEGGRKGGRKGGGGGEGESESERGGRGAGEAAAPRGAAARADQAARPDAYHPILLATARAPAYGWSLSWLSNLASFQPVAYAILLLSLVVVAGVAIGRVRLGGIGLGPSGVLFAGIGFGHAGLVIDPVISDFAREFGLILFVFTIGLELGPGFFASLRKEGLRLNALAAAVVSLGVLLAACAVHFAGINARAGIGLFSGATTNTPSLGAAQQSLASLGPAAAPQVALPALAYAVGYPVGIVSIIAALLLLRLIFRIDPAAEAEAFRVEQGRGVEPIERMTLLVTSPNLDGLRLDDIRGLRDARRVQ